MKPRANELAVRIKDIFIKKGMDLCLAESITGGLIASTLTNIPGASKYLHSSVVTYSPEAKELFLDLPDDLMGNLVSEETALAMALGIRLKTITCVSLSITGNAGPEVLEGKPAGLIYMAIHRDSGVVTRKLELKGSRNAIREQAVVEALEFLLEEVSK